MGKITYYDNCAKTMSKATMDAFALYRGGCLGGFGCTAFDAVDRDVVGIIRHGYQIAHIGGCGTGNSGWLQLIGVTPKTKMILHEGRRREIAARYGLSKEDSEAFEKASRVQFGRENGVCDIAFFISELKKSQRFSDDAFVIIEESHNFGEIKVRTKRASTETTMPRLAAAKKIAASFMRQDDDRHQFQESPTWRSIPQGYQDYFSNEIPETILSKMNEEGSWTRQNDKVRVAIVLPPRRAQNKTEGSGPGYSWQVISA